MRKFTILFALELIIWNSAMLFQHQTQSYKQNLTNLNYVYRYFSICVCLTTSELFLTLISKKKFEENSRCTPKFGFYQKNAI